MSDTNIAMSDTNTAKSATATEPSVGQGNVDLALPALLEVLGDAYKLSDTEYVLNERDMPAFKEFMAPAQVASVGLPETFNVEVVCNDDTGVELSLTMTPMPVKIGLPEANPQMTLNMHLPRSTCRSIWDHATPGIFAALELHKGTEGLAERLQSPASTFVQMELQSAMVKMYIDDFSLNDFEQKQRGTAPTFTPTEAENGSVAYKSDMTLNDKPFTFRWIPDPESLG
ncbi:hypothetical protein Q5752_000748 [Cryptotrichosporon argae]